MVKVEDVMVYGAERDGRLAGAIAAQHYLGSKKDRKDMAATLGGWIMNGCIVHPFLTQEAYATWLRGLDPEPAAAAPGALKLETTLG